MFLLRSAFWLTLAFLIIRPGVDIGASADALTREALAGGQKLVIEQIIGNDCASVECMGGKAVLAMATLRPSAPATTTVRPMPGEFDDTAPIPRPRPDWLG